jgi:cyclophilin family peptidyl-prolyl cis-trans isomerase
VKAEAVTAIGRLGLEKAFAKLRPFLNDKNRTLRGSAITAVAQTNPGFFMENASAYLDGADRYIKSRILDGLPAIGTPQSFNLATELFSDDDPRVRRNALQSMLEFEKVNAPNLLRDALTDPDFTVVATAIDAIASRKDSTFIDQLEDIYSRHLSDKEPDVRLTVIQGLSDWIDSTTTEQTMLEVFDRALDDNDYLVRKAAIGAFAKIDIDKSSAQGVFDTDISPENFDAIFNRFSSNPTAIIRTNKGDIKFELLYDVAPKTVSNFVNLARSGFYDQKTWHRVIPSFVIQDGCPRGDGWGGPGYSIRCEYNRKRYMRGTVGMARSGKDTGDSQYFIAHTALPHLDGRYTAFGQVTSGMSAVYRIEVGDSIRTIEIIEDENAD